MKKLLLSLAFLFSGQAMAATECTATVNYIWTGDGGTALVFLVGGTSFYLSPGSADFKNILSSAHLAMITGQTVSVRFVANGVACATAAGRTDVQGMYIFN